MQDIFLREAHAESGQLRVSPPGPLPDRGVQVYLQVGFRQDHGADIATGHHHGVAAGQIALHLHQRLSDTRHPRYERYCRLYLRLAQESGDVFSIDEDSAWLNAGPGRGTYINAEGGRQVAKGVIVADVDAAVQRRPGHRPVDSARVQERVAEARSDQAADGALARRRRTVYGDDAGDPSSLPRFLRLRRLGCGGRLN